MSHKPAIDFLPNRKVSSTTEEWYHLVPVGQFMLKPEKDPKTQAVQLVDAKSIEAMANSFDGRLLVDFEHESYDPEKRTAAAGWITHVEAREDGLWGQIEWTGSGKTSVDGKEYRFLSPTFLRNDTEKAGQSRSGPWLRPLRLDSAALTNRPNMATITPFFNAARPEVSATDRGAQSNTQDNNTMRELLIQLLGLPEDATDEQITAAANEHLANAVDTEEKEKYENRIVSLTEELNNRDLDAAGITDAEERKRWQTLLNADRQNAAALLQSHRKLVEKQAQASGNDAAATREPLTNRAPASDPSRQPGGEDTQDKANGEEAKAATLRNRAHTIQKEQGVSWAVAFNRAKTELSD